MNHSKIVLLACISGFVALTTTWMGVAGTIIGSVVSSLLYNILAEVLEKPVTERKFSFNFEYEIAYVFPLIVIAFIQLLLLLAFLSQWGYLPQTFLHAYLTIQGVVDNNLYRLLGFALLVMGVYPFIIRPNIVKKSYGIVVVFVGLIFLARGFVDSSFVLTNLYGVLFHYFDFQIGVFAFMLLAIVIVLILGNASQVYRDFEKTKRKNLDDLELKVIHHKNGENIEVNPRNYNERSNNGVHSRNNYPRARRNHHFKSGSKSSTGVNTSSEDIYFESSDVLDDYK